MNECNSLEIDETVLTEETKIRLNKITEIENYFHQDINQRKSCSKTLSTYAAAFDYIDKILTVLSATTGGVSIISFTNVVGAPVGIASASFILIFSLTTGIIKKLLSITRNKKKKHKILMLSKSKLDSIETLVSHPLIDMKISHEEFNAIIREDNKRDNYRGEIKYERMKENVRNVCEKQENMRLNSVNSRKMTSL